MALSRDQIYKLNLCRLYKKITFLSEIHHHDRKDFEPTLWEHHTQSPMNSHERFSNISIPKSWWALWRTVLQSIKQNNQIAIQNLGRHLSPSTAEWINTTDFRYLYHRQNEEYAVHSLQHSNY